MFTLFCALLLCSASTMQPHNTLYTTTLLTGKQLHKILPFIATQRIVLFYEYPYLYEGNYEQEMAYLTWFAQLPYSAVVVAYVDEEPVGFISGTALIDFDEHFKGTVQLFKTAGLQPKNYYYIAEVMVLPEHRGHQLSDQLFDYLEKYAEQQGYTAVCGVTESHEQHPLKPTDYISLEPLWQRLGYKKSDLVINFSWLTRQVDGSSREAEHLLRFWLKGF